MSGQRSGQAIHNPYGVTQVTRELADDREHGQRVVPCRPEAQPHPGAGGGDDDDVRAAWDEAIARAADLCELHADWAREPGRMPPDIGAASVGAALGLAREIRAMGAEGREAQADYVEYENLSAHDRARIFVHEHCPAEWRGQPAIIAALRKVLQDSECRRADNERRCVHGNGRDCSECAEHFKQNARATWSAVDRLVAAARAILVVPVHPKGIVVPLSIREELQAARDAFDAIREAASRNRFAVLPMPCRAAAQPEPCCYEAPAGIHSENCPTRAEDASTPCRKCTECEGNHHWLETLAYVCKHCELLAEGCEDCDGTGGFDGDVDSEIPCEACDGDGVIVPNQRRAAATVGSTNEKGKDT